MTVAYWPVDNPTVDQPPGERCTRCGWPIVRTHHRPPDGARRHGAHGMCKTCYSNSIRPRLSGDPANMLGARTEPADWVVVERAVHGLRPRMNAAERLEAVRWMATWRYSVRETARRLGMAERTVERLRRMP